MRYANLSLTNMRGADLTDAKLSGAELHFTNLRGANLQGVNLSGEENEIAHPKGVMVKVKPASLRGAKLEGANLEGASLLGVDLSGADFTNAQLKDAEIGRKPGAERWEVANLEKSTLTYDQLRIIRLRPGIIFPASLDIKKIKDIIREQVNAATIYFKNELNLAELMFELTPSADEIKVAKRWNEVAVHNINFLNKLSK